MKSRAGSTCARLGRCEQIFGLSIFYVLTGPWYSPNSRQPRNRRRLRVKMCPRLGAKDRECYAIATRARLTHRQKAKVVANDHSERPRRQGKINIVAHQESPLLANTFTGSQRLAASEEQRLLDCLRTQERLPIYRAYKAYGNALQAHEGAKLLDVGCGSGDTCKSLSESVGVNGLVVGLDTSDARLVAAQDAESGWEDDAPRSAVRWVQGSATALPFPPGSFDGVRIERTLQHIGDAQKAVSEMARVLSPGGSLVAVDPAWKAFSIRSPVTDAETTRLILMYWLRSFANGEIVEKMPAYVAQAGLRLKQVRTFMLEGDNSLRLAETMFDLTRLSAAAAAAKIITKQAAKDWNSTLRCADAAGTLRWSMPLKLFHAVAPSEEQRL